MCIYNDYDRRRYILNVLCIMLTSTCNGGTIDINIMIYWPSVIKTSYSNSIIL